MKGATKGNHHRSAKLTTTRTNYYLVILTLNMVYAPVLTPDKKVPASDKPKVRRPCTGGNQPPKEKPKPRRGNGHPE